MNELQMKDQFMSSRVPKNGGYMSGCWKRLGLLMPLAVVVASLLQPVQPALADWFAPRLEATAKDDHVEVVVHVSATVGSAVLRNHPLGTYHIPADSKMMATLEAGIATFKVAIFAEGDVVFVIVDMIAPDTPPQKKFSIAHLKQ